MGKRIITQARGKGSSTYRVSKKAFRFKLQYPKKLDGEGIVVKLLNSAAHTAPLAKIKYNEGSFYMPAFDQMVEGQKIFFGGHEKDIKDGNIMKLNTVMKLNIY